MIYDLMKCQENPIQQGIPDIGDILLSDDYILLENEMNKSNTIVFDGSMLLCTGDTGGYDKQYIDCFISPR